jgi:hypothetical protein
VPENIFLVRRYDPRIVRDVEPAAHPAPQAVYELDIGLWIIGGPVPISRRVIAQPDERELTLVMGALAGLLRSLEIEA